LGKRRPLKKKTVGGGVKRVPKVQRNTREAVYREDGLKKVEKTNAAPGARMGVYG